MGVVDGGREHHFARDHQIGQRPRRHGIDADILLAEFAHEILAFGQDEGRDKIRCRRNRARHRHAPAPFGRQQIVIGLGRGAKWDRLRVDADAGIGFAHHHPMARGLDGGRLERRALRRAEGLKDVRVSDEDQSFGGELEHVELLITGAMFRQRPVCDVGLRAALHGDFQIRIFALEALDQRLDLRARGVEQKAALGSGARFQHGLAVAARIIRDCLDGLGLRGRYPWPHRKDRSKNAPQFSARDPHASVSAAARIGRESSQ